MAEKGNCYQNAIAERINGILKTEFYLDTKFDSVDQAKSITRQAIYLYNTLRPHWNLNFKTPELMHNFS